MYARLCVHLVRNTSLYRVPLTRAMSSQQSYTHILTTRPEPSVSLITLNRPKALNALSTPLMLEINRALDEAQNDEDIGVVVLTGSERAFAGGSQRAPECVQSQIVSPAGADIKEMRDKECAYIIDIVENPLLD